MQMDADDNKEAKTILLKKSFAAFFICVHLRPSAASFLKEQGGLTARARHCVALG